jgi:hypothetical protein
LTPAAHAFFISKDGPANKYPPACALASVYGFLQGANPLGSLKPYSQELLVGDGELAGALLGLVCRWSKKEHKREK